MSRRIPVYVAGRSDSVGSILAPTDSPGPQWERVDIGGIEGVFERHYNQIRSIKVGSLDDARRLPSFEATVWGPARSLGEIAAAHLRMLDVKCDINCGQRGRYRTAKLVEKYGADSSIARFQDDITKDCPERNDPTIALGHGCTPLCPQLSEVF